MDTHGILTRGKKLTLVVVILCGLIPAGCDKFQESGYGVNATIVDEDNKSRNKEESNE
jgi:hypothetical protein